MPHLSLNIDVRNKAILVVGGGAVAERKITALRDAGARVLVVAPELSPGIVRLANDGAIAARTGHYQTYDLAGIFLVVAATNDPLTNQTIAADALQRGILVTVTDAPESGDCTFPALLRRGKLEISVSTNGACPGFAVELRDMLADVIGEEFGTILITLAAEREKLLTEGNRSTYYNKILRSRARELLTKLINQKERVP